MAEMGPTRDERVRLEEMEKLPRIDPKELVRLVVEARRFWKEKRKRGDRSQFRRVVHRLLSLQPFSRISTIHTHLSIHVPDSHPNLQIPKLRLLPQILKLDREHPSQNLKTLLLSVQLGRNEGNDFEVKARLLLLLRSLMRMSSLALRVWRFSLPKRKRSTRRSSQVSSKNGPLERQQRNYSPKSQPPNSHFPHPQSTHHRPSATPPLPTLHLPPSKSHGRSQPDPSRSSRLGRT